MSIQNIILNKIQETITQRSEGTHIWAAKSSASNVGIIYVLDKNLATVGSFSYDFQSDYFSLTFFKGSNKPCCAIGFTPSNSIGDVRGQYHELPSAFQKINSSLEIIYN